MRQYVFAVGVLAGLMALAGDVEKCAAGPPARHFGSFYPAPAWGVQHYPAPYVSYYPVIVPDRRPYFADNPPVYYGVSPYVVYSGYYAPTHVPPYYVPAEPPAPPAAPKEVKPQEPMKPM